MSAHPKTHLRRISVWVLGVCLLWPIVVFFAIALFGRLGLAACILAALLISRVAARKAKTTATERLGGQWLLICLFLGMILTCAFTAAVLPDWIARARHAHWQESASPLPELGAVARMRYGEWSIHCADPSRVDDATLRLWIPKLTELNVTALSLQGSRITDNGISSLITVRSLTSLDLSNTEVGDGSLESVSRLPHLRVLVLNGTHISDTHLHSLIACPELEKLHLRNTNISDKGLKELEEIQTLRYLDLQGTKISLDDRDAFMQVRPHVSVSGAWPDKSSESIKNR